MTDMIDAGVKGAADDIKAGSQWIRRGEPEVEAEIIATRGDSVLYELRRGPDFVMSISNPVNWFVTNYEPNSDSDSANQASPTHEAKPAAAPETSGPPPLDLTNSLWRSKADGVTFVGLKSIDREANTCQVRTGDVVKTMDSDEFWDAYQPAIAEYDADGNVRLVAEPMVGASPCRACKTTDQLELFEFDASSTKMVLCLDCGEVGPRCESDVDAVEGWNRKQAITVFDSGAVRSRGAADVRYDMVSPIGLRRLAETYAEGAAKYGPGNWLKGFPASDLLNHLMRHVDLWRSGDRNEDHLAHAAWGLFALMHFEETRPELMDVDLKAAPKSA